MRTEIHTLLHLISFVSIIAKIITIFFPKKYIKIEVYTDKEKPEWES